MESGGAAVPAVIPSERSESRDLNFGMSRCRSLDFARDDNDPAVSVDPAVIRVPSLNRAVARFTTEKTSPTANPN